jgi:hypothetical protein
MILFAGGTIARRVTGVTEGRDLITAMLVSLDDCQAGASAGRLRQRTGVGNSHTRRAQRAVLAEAFLRSVKCPLASIT